jgi:hypothetical protein
MGHRVLGSVPEQRGLFIGQLLPYLYSPVGIFFLGGGGLLFFKVGMKKLNPVI